jgi:DNA polymerase-3 subunit alpha
LTRQAHLLQALSTHQVVDLANIHDQKTEVILGGMLTGLQVRNVQKSRDGGTRMGKMTFEDLSGSIPSMLWPSDFAKYESMLKEDFIGFVKGTVSRRNDPPELVITKVIPVEQGPTELSKGVMVRLHKVSTQPNDLDRLLRTVRAYPGNLDLYLEILGLAHVRRAIYKAGSNLKIRHDERMLADLESAFGAENVRLIGHRGSAGREESRPAARPSDDRPDLDLEEVDDEG